MAGSFQSPIPMWSVQYQLLGGHRRIFFRGVAYLFLIVACAFVYRRFDSKTALTAVADSLLRILSVFQIGLMLVGGVNAVYRAVLRDQQTKMIESHRISPMANWAVALGYVIGPCWNILLIFTINLLFGAVLSFMNTPMLAARWAQGNALLLSGSVMMWTAMAFIGVGAAKPTNPGAIVVILVMVAAPLAMSVPGGAIMSGIYTAIGSYVVLTGGGVAVRGMDAALLAVANLVLAVFWLSAAAARYRRPDLPPFNAVRGLIFLLLFLSLNLTADCIIPYMASRRGPTLSVDTNMIPILWVSSLIASLIIAAIALAGCLQCDLLRRRGAILRGWADRVRPWPTVILICAAILGSHVVAARWLSEDFVDAIGYASNDSTDESSSLLRKSWAYTAATILLSLVTMKWFFSFAYQKTKSATLFVGLFIILTWCLPPVADLALAAAIRPTVRGTPAFSWLMAASPPGMIVSVWLSLKLSLFPGLIFQFVLALTVAIFAYLLTRRRLHPEAESR